MAIDKIYDGDDKAREEGFPNYRLRITRSTANNHHWSGEEGDLDPITARIDYGRWIADCECGGSEYVSATYPVFFCFSCGNAFHAGKSRPVIFPTPAERAAIEHELMLRPIKEPPGLSGTQAALHAQPEPRTAPIRNWSPGTTVLSLILENASGHKGGGE